MLKVPLWILPLIFHCSQVFHSSLKHRWKNSLKIVRHNGLQPKYYGYTVALDDFCWTYRGYNSARLGRFLPGRMLCRTDTFSFWSVPVVHWSLEYVPWGLPFGGYISSWRRCSYFKCFCNYMCLLPEPLKRIWVFVFLNDVHKNKPSC